MNGALHIKSQTIPMETLAQVAGELTGIVWSMGGRNRELVEAMLQRHGIAFEIKPHEVAQR